MALAGVTPACRRTISSRTPPPHLLLISLDACRADHLSAYGYRHRTSPFLEELAARGMRFSRAFANAQGTASSHTSMLTSLYQESHGVQYELSPEDQSIRPIPPEAPMVQELLRAHGYVTLALTGGGQLNRICGFYRGFTDYRECADGIPVETRHLLDMIGVHGMAGRPLFVFYHTYEVHSPYTPPESYRGLFGPAEGRIAADNDTLAANADTAGRDLKPEDLDFLRAQYDAEIHYADAVLGDFFLGLDEIGFLKNAVVILTADHGEEFGEHGGLLHRGLLYDESIQVPLFLAGPGVPEGRVDGRMVSLIDIAPTFLARAGVPRPKGMRGRDLLTLPSPAGEEECIYTQYAYIRWGLRTTDWKYILNAQRPKLELYDLRHDPSEKHNVARLHPDLTRKYLDQILEWRASQPKLAMPESAMVTPTPEHIQRLKALGYLK
jgi:arylsulfatase A-like enzyme